MIFLISLSLFHLLFGQITYDAGLYTGDSAYCQNGNIVTKTISFVGTFANIPQVIISLEYLDMGQGGDFRVETQNINLNSFDLHIVCISSVYIWKLKYQWYAIDDSRIEVINNFNMVNIDNKQFDHLNPNANSAIISFVSIGFVAEIDFKLSVAIIQLYRQLKLQLLKSQLASQKQIKSLQIYTKSDIKLFWELKKHSLVCKKSTVQLLMIVEPLLRNQIDGYLQLTMDWKLVHTLDKDLRVHKFPNPTYLRHVHYNIQQGGGTFIANYHQRVWLAYQFTNEFKAFLCLTLRISQSLDMEVSQKPQIYVDISELNQSLQSSQYLFLQKTVNLLSFKIYMKCIKTKTIVSQFLKCQSCSTNQKYYLFSHYCHGQIDAVTYFPKFQLIESSYKELNLYISLDRITITQTLFNQIKSTETLLDIKFKVD
ncbi:unnamed protein product (macronuclear) [Paramecium tetraurelia]|uniref:H-type lectin domain-containing protein n=1 Tax=Paramecium tetraurelia TaxID=5888 RepID=A0C9C2_PARTE|nr:uncharacterized protein GSPATT00006695001 [Paramecium tetraurelia]CAK67389.1 unnamed protein product [Paramecium tetraurelia]|eukprot:XP_001434786.1 hypothetical protein (macronuclear) [Paramecium tetraurelia strain d4-2]